MPIKYWAIKYWMRFISTTLKQMTGVVCDIKTIIVAHFSDFIGVNSQLPTPTERDPDACNRELQVTKPRAVESTVNNQAPLNLSVTGKLGHLLSSPSRQLH